MGLLKYEERGDFETAARHLRRPLGQNMDLVELAGQRQALRRAFSGDIALLGDDPSRN